MAAKVANWGATIAFRLMVLSRLCSLDFLQFVTRSWPLRPGGWSNAAV